jgi:hypothetical protein
MQDLRIPELDDFLTRGAGGRWALSPEWHNSGAASGIMRALGRVYPEIDRIAGAVVELRYGAPVGKRSFAQSCWRTSDGMRGGRRVAFALLGVFFGASMSPARLRELQLKARVLCPIQPDLPVYCFCRESPRATDVSASIPVAIQAALFERGMVFYRRSGDLSSDRRSPTAC